MPDPLLRKIQETPSFTKEFQELVPDKNEASNFLSGIRRQLVWKAEFGKKIDATDVWCETFPDIPNGRLIGIYYKFDPSNVIIHSAMGASIH